jgi:predicted dehydrogenase
MGQTCRWGILGAAGIARKNWRSVFNTGNAVVAAVASRDPARAQAFIDDCQGECAFPDTPRACTYDEMIAADDIDAVYIPLPTGLRKPWVIAAAKAGKHVLIEKPVAGAAADFEEMMAVCAANNVQLMDGVMFMHSARLPALKQTIRAELGPLRRIATQFSFLGPDDFLANDIRLHSELEPFGCLGDLGWYTTRIILWAMDWQMPTEVNARILTSAKRADSPGEVPTAISAEMVFEGGVSASMFCAFTAEHQQWLRVSGQNGYVAVQDFVLPFSGDTLFYDLVKADFSCDGTIFTMKDLSQTLTIDEQSHSHPNAQETNLFRNFSANVIDGKPDRFWSDIALQTQQVLDAIMEDATK